MLSTQVLSLVVPLASYIAYQLVNKEPYSSVTYAVTGLNRPTVPIHGFVEKGFEETYNIFKNNFEIGRDVGAQLAVYVDGHKVIDLQGGWKDVDNKIEYTNDTLQMVFSSTKCLSAIVIAQLVDQGLLSYDDRISAYWPEFAQGNKQEVTVMDLMRHTAGMAAFDKPLSLDIVKDREALADFLAQQPHNFNGTRVHAYHAISPGWVQNELIRRVDPQHRTVDGFAQEFNKKYGIEWYLKPDATEGVDVSRISQFYPKSDLKQLTDLVVSYFKPSTNRTFIHTLFDKNSLFTKSIIHPNIDQRKGVMNNNDPIRRAIEGPSYSGHSNADSIAKLAAMMANKGKAIVSGEPDLFENEATYDEAHTFVAAEKDAIFPMTMINLRGGFWRFPSADLALPEDGEFEGGAGAGGSLFIYNREYKIGFGYVTNGYNGAGGPDYRSIPLIKSVFEQVKKQKLQKVDP